MLWLSAIRKLDQRVRDLGHLELFYDLQTDRAAAASAFVELIATADAAANHLLADAPGMVLHTDMHVNYATPSFESPELALAFSSKWDEDAWDLLNKLPIDDCPVEFRAYYEAFQISLKLSLEAAPTTDLPPLLDMKMNCRRTTDDQSTAGRYPNMLHASFADPSIGFPHRRFNDVMLVCAHDRATRALLPVRSDKAAPCPLPS